MRFKILIWLYKINFSFSYLLVRAMEKCPGKQGVTNTAMIPYIRQWLVEEQQNDKN